MKQTYAQNKDLRGTIPMQVSPGCNESIFSRMKPKFIHAIEIVVFTGFFFLLSCEEDDSAKPWGNELIYMPQASLFSGGLNNDYFVPAPEGFFGQDYTIDSTSQANDTVINVFLGVYRSGLETLESYTVDIGIDNDTITQALGNGLYPLGVLLDAAIYSLPQKITVPDGERENTFNLSISRAKLRLDPKYAGKQLLLAVNISNPTKYELNTRLSTTIVIISNWESLK